MPERRGRRGSRLTLPIYLLDGIVGAIAASRLITGLFPWQSTGYGFAAWESFAGMWALGFGALLGAGVTLYVSHVFGRGMTCPRCRAHNRRDAERCEVCDLMLEHLASAFWPDVTAPAPSGAGRH